MIRVIVVSQLPGRPVHTIHDDAQPIHAYPTRLLLPLHARELR